MTEFTPRISPIRSRVRFATIAILAFLTCAALPHSCFAQEGWTTDYNAPTTGQQFKMYEGSPWAEMVESVNGTVTTSGDVPNINRYFPLSGLYTASDFTSCPNYQSDTDYVETQQLLHQSGFAYTVSDQVSATITGYLIHSDLTTLPTSQVFEIIPVIDVSTDASGSDSASVSVTDNLGNTGWANQYSGPQVSVTPQLVTIVPDPTTGTAQYTITANYAASVSAGGDPTSPNAQCDEYFNMKPDTRTVILHRTGATGETTDSTGTTHGDTIFSTTVTEGESHATTSWTPNWQTYTPTFSSGWPSTSGVVDLSSFSWQPNETQDAWNSHPQEAPAGSINFDNGEATGSADSPTSSTITYTATSSIDGAQESANYDITYHDPYQYVADNKSNVTAQGPLYGSANGGGNGLDIVWGASPSGTPAGMQTVTQGTSSSQGLEVEGVMPESWLQVFGLNFSASACCEIGNECSVSVTNPFIPYGDYAYPIFIDTYVRNDVLYTQWGPAGEISVNSNGVETPENDFFDQYAGSEITWSQPIPKSQPAPIEDPNPLPIIPTPAQSN